MPDSNLHAKDFSEFSALLSSLVDAYEKKAKKEKLELILLKMDFFAEKLGGEILDDFIKLKEIFGSGRIERQAFMNQCLKLKNQLWEL